MESRGVIDQVWRNLLFFPGLPRGVATQGHLWKKPFNIKCLNPVQSVYDPGIQHEPQSIFRSLAGSASTASEKVRRPARVNSGILGFFPSGNADIKLLEQIPCDDKGIRGSIMEPVIEQGITVLSR